RSRILTHHAPDFRTTLRTRRCPRCRDQQKRQGETCCETTPAHPQHPRHPNVRHSITTPCPNPSSINHTRHHNALSPSLHGSIVPLFYCSIVLLPTVPLFHCSRARA